MNSSLGAIELPPTGPADSHDASASLLKTKKTHECTSAPSDLSVITPARHSSIGRDIIRDIDIDRNYKRAVNATALATTPEPEVTEPISPPKGDSVNPQTLQKQSEPDSAVEPEEDVLAKSSALRGILADPGEVEIESFLTHRVDEANATVDFLVKWANSKETWEPEWSLQQQVPMLIYKYWDSVDGRDTATGLDVYHVFRVLKRAPPSQAKKKDFRYQVQWVGYRRTESTWEYESKLVQIAPEELIKFQAKNSTPEVAARKPKRGIAWVSGYSRKKVRVDD